ncbi:hypothetical protein T11_12374 [Trichinella zimbabwensis]|uniref:Uncharacterized protein n=1 Tax=Trichinella zimbabwensis TaxID=268475 RepID=A0A0V1GDU2_9BILA|nr:hypothetical protein T11_12374 [Trichinella zimbabwensis]
MRTSEAIYSKTTGVFPVKLIWVSIDRKQFANYNERNRTAPRCLFPEIFLKNWAASNVLT